MFDVTSDGIGSGAGTVNGFKPNLTSSPATTSATASAGNRNPMFNEELLTSSSSRTTVPLFLINSQTSSNNTITPIKHDSGYKVPVFAIGSEEQEGESDLMKSSPVPDAGSTGQILSPSQDADVNHNKTHGHHRSVSSPIISHSLISTGNEESYECLADGSQSFFDSNSENTSSQFSRNSSNDLSVPDIFGGINNTSTSSGVSSLPAFKRNSILRTSLRKSPQNNGDIMGHRRWGSFRNPSGVKRQFQQPISPSEPVILNSSGNAAGSQLYRSSSFHSSGRSSAGDGEEMYSDGSLEDEVIDLKQTVHHLEKKFNALSESQTEVDDRYSRSKQENIELSTKLFMLEEQLRDAEQRGEDRLREEQKRAKESLQRLEREKQLQIENYEIRLHTVEKELEVQRSEAQRLKLFLDRERSERVQISDKLLETERDLTNAREDNRKFVESARVEREALAMETIGSQQALIDLKREVENLRKFQMTKSIQNHMDIDGDFNDSRLKELEEENRRLKSQLRQLEEANDDLTAQILNKGLEEGRNLLTMNQFGGGMGSSIAAEFEAMSQEEVKKALKEQKEINDQLKAYIDGMLLNIVENYPQLLEVKNKCSSKDNIGTA